MLKNCFLIIVFFSFPHFLYAQLIPYNPLEWNEANTYTEFYDSFSGTSLDLSKWRVVTEYGRGQCVFVDSLGITYSLNNGYLQLSMSYLPNSNYCFEDDGWHCPDYISAEILSDNTFKYGVYEGRMKFAYDDGSWPAFWLYGGDDPDDPQYDGYATEIDIAELNWNRGGNSSSTDHVLHWWLPDHTQASIALGENNNNINWNEWHTFKLVYRPYDVTFYIDGDFSWERSRFYVYGGFANQQKIDISVEDLDNYEVYYEHEWFPKHACYIILSQQVAGYNYVDGSVEAPQTSYFDWVSFKKFFSMPEITCPDVICSTGSATIYFDSLIEDLATNISWELSPSNLFSVTQGTGKVANIVTSGGNGVGAITYSFQMPGGEEFTSYKTFWVGTTEITGLDGPMSVPTNEDTRYYPLYSDVRSSPTNFEWNVTPDASYDSYGWSTLVNFPDPDVYRIIYRGLNTCGWGDWYLSDNIYVYSSRSLSFTPNPTSGETIVTIETADREIASTADTEETAFDETAEWSLEIYDNAQSLKMKKTNLKGRETTINARSWKEGVYFVRVLYKNEVLTGKLVVKK